MEVIIKKVYKAVGCEKGHYFGTFAHFKELRESSNLSVQKTCFCCGHKFQPEDACSSIWNNNNEVIGKEKGVSVYEAHKNINGTYSLVFPFPTNEMAFNDFIYNVKYFTGNKYLVTGDLLDETGTDGEPLIKNVKILKKLQL